MICKEVQRLMWDYVERSDINDDQFMEHVNGCYECKTMWSELTQFEQELQRMRMDGPSLDFVNDVMKRIRKIERRTQTSWSTWNHLWVASAATFVFFSLFTSWTSTDLSITGITSRVIRFGGFMLDATETILQLF